MIWIVGLFIYPVKSCRAIALEHVELGPRGFLHDREFLVVDENNRFLSQRNAPELATIDISLDVSGFVMTASRVGELRVAFAPAQGRRAASRFFTIMSWLMTQAMKRLNGSVPRWAGAAVWFGRAHPTCAGCRPGRLRPRIVRRSRLTSRSRMLSPRCSLRKSHSRS